MDPSTNHVMFSRDAKFIELTDVVEKISSSDTVGIPDGSCNEIELCIQGGSGSNDCWD